MEKQASEGGAELSFGSANSCHSYLAKATSPSTARLGRRILRQKKPGAHPLRRSKVYRLAKLKRDSLALENSLSSIYATEITRIFVRLGHCFCYRQSCMVEERSQTHVITATISSSSPCCSLFNRWTVTELTIEPPTSWI